MLLQKGGTTTVMRKPQASWRIRFPALPHRSRMGKHDEPGETPIGTLHASLRRQDLSPNCPLPTMNVK